MKVSAAFHTIFISSSMVFSMQTLAMDQKVSKEPVRTGEITKELEVSMRKRPLMDQITQELIKSQDPDNKNPKKYLNLTKLVSQVVNADFAQNSQGYSLLSLACQRKSEFLLNLVLHRKLDPSLVCMVLVKLLNDEPDEKVFSGKLIQKLIHLNDAYFDLPQLAVQFTKPDQKKINDYIHRFMNRKMKARYARLLANLLDGEGRTEVITKQETAAGAAIIQSISRKNQNEEIDKIKKMIALYEQAVAQRLAQEAVDLTAIVQIIEKIEGQIEKLGKHQAIGDDDTKKITEWKNFVLAEKERQKKADLFAKKRTQSQVKMIIRYMQVPSDRFRKLQRISEKIFFDQFSQKPVVTQAFSMEQIHRDHYWHAEYPGDVRAINARKASVQELAAHNDAQTWWVSHKKNNQKCIACYQYAIAATYQTANIPKRRHSCSF